MSDEISTLKSENAKLQERARRLAMEKSYLQLVNNLMNRLCEVQGLEETVAAVLHLIIDNLGGANVALYYLVDSCLHYADVYGEAKVIAAADDPMVRLAFERGEFVEESRDFADTKLMTPAFTKASYWAMPLSVGGQVIGVLKTEAMLLASNEVRSQLQPFFDYAALVLKNEIESHRKHVEAARLAAIVQSSDDAIIGKTLDGIVTSWNPGSERIYGYTAQEMVGRSLAILVPPGRDDELPRILSQIKEGRHVDRYETVRRRSDGRDIDVSLTVSPIKDAAGRIVGAATIARDITARKQAEVELRRVNRALRMLSDSNQTLIRATDEAGLLKQTCRIILEGGGYCMAWTGFADEDETRANFAAVRPRRDSGAVESGKLNWAESELGRVLGNTAIRTGRMCLVRDILLDASLASCRQEALRRGVQSAIALPLIFESQTLGALGIYAAELDAFDAKEVEILGELAGDLAFGIATLRTRAAHTQAEARLRLFRQLINQSNDAIFIVDPQTSQVMDANDASCRSLGYTREEIINRRVMDFDLTVRDPSQWADSLRGVRKLGSLTFESKIQRKDGSTFPVEISVRHAVENQREYLIASARDITERKRSEEALRRSEADLHLALDAAHLGHWNWNIATGAVSWSARCKALYGLPPDAEMTYDRFLSIVHPEDRERINAAMNRAVETRAEYDVEKRVVWPDGSFHWNASRGRVFSDATGRDLQMAGVTIDITERKQAEQIMMARIRLSEFALAHSLDELLQATLDELENLTGSSIGFFHLLEADQRTLLLQNWSTRTLAHFCTAGGKGRHYDMDQAGVWVDAIRQRRPVVHNDYASLPHRRGLPEGHAPIVREVVVPIFRGNAIVAVVGVGNKPQPYNDHDTQTVALLADLAWDITERKRAEEELRASREQLRALAARLQAVREEERTRLAREIHDEMGQMLTGLKMDLCWIEHDLEELADSRLSPILDKAVSATELTSTMAKTVQRIAAELRPGILDRLGLILALTYEASQFQQRFGIVCRLTAPEEETMLPVEAITAVFRIFQEALTNVGRHASATEVQVQVDARSDCFVLRIADNGKGIAAADLLNRNSLGLLGMKERARQLGGDVTFTQGAAGGTVVTLRIPRGSAPQESP